MFVRTCQPIKAGDECFISYIDMMLPQPARFAKLTVRVYGFECSCARCIAEVATAAATARATPEGCVLIAAAERLVAAGDGDGAIRLLEQVRAASNNDEPSSFGVRPTFLAAMQQLFGL
jgi:hypothetical protein